jgi:hypothetical protein
VVGMGGTCVHVGQCISEAMGEGEEVIGWGRSLFVLYLIIRKIGGSVLLRVDVTE